MFEADAPPVLVTVTACGTEATPGCCAEKLRLDGFTLSAPGARPVPLRETDSVSSSSVMASVPVIKPVCAGAKETLTVQLECAATPLRQLLDCWKPAPAAIEVMWSGRSPVLVIVTDCAVETWPEAVAGNASEVGLSVFVCGAAPAPLSCTVCVPEESVNVSNPVAAPAWVGAKATDTWQLLFA